MKIDRMALIELEEDGVFDREQVLALDKALRDVEIEALDISDVKEYADPSIEGRRMSVIFEWLKDRRTATYVEKYATNPSYDIAQLHQIELGLRAFQDVSLYDDPKYRWDVMEVCRMYAPCSGIDITPLLERGASARELKEVMGIK